MKPISDPIRVRVLAAVAATMLALGALLIAEGRPLAESAPQGAQSTQQASSAPTSYTVTPLDPFPGSASSGEPQGINATGDVVGSAGWSDGKNHALLWSNGQTTELNSSLPGGYGNGAWDINDSGEVVGYASTTVANSTGGTATFPVAVLWSKAQVTGDYQMTEVDRGLPYADGSSAVASGINSSGDVAGSKSSGDGWEHATLWHKDEATGSYQATDLGTLGGAGSAAFDINDSGDVVGHALISGNGEDHAFIYRNGQMTDLGSLPGYIGSNAWGVNAFGDVVGTLASNNFTFHAFLNEGDQMTDLGTLGGTNSEAFDINDSGDVVGRTENSSGEGRAFIYSGGQMKDLNSLIPADSGLTLARAIAINNKGQIVAVANGQDGVPFGVRLEPVTPSGPTYTIRGFYQPVDNLPTQNQAKAGSTVPVKFQVFEDSTEITDTSKIQSVTPTKVSCDSGAAVDAIESYSSDNPSLRYDTTSHRFIYNWKTPKSFGSCYTLTVTTIDGSSLSASFKLK